MPTWAFYLLLASVFVALIVAAAVAIYTYKRQGKIRRSLLNAQTPGELATHQVAFNDRRYGELDLAAKALATQPLDDAIMTFALNTFRRNGYQTATVVNSASSYELDSLVKLASATPSAETYDFAIVFSNGRIYEQIKALFAALNPGGILLVVNLAPRSREWKTLQYDLRVLGYRHEYQKIGPGLAVIAKEFAKIKDIQSSTIGEK